MTIQVLPGLPGRLGGGKAPVNFLDPAPGGVFAPAKFFDPAPGGALPR